MSDINMTQLENGLRVITDTVDSVDSAALGVWIGAGSRHESAINNGAAHMVEHMLFKGTENRDAKQIVSEIESVGGQMNAYTSRDITSYHMHLMVEHAPLAMDVLSDMVLRSTMPDSEITRERQVILQEIGMTQDTPDDLVFDLAQETAYAKQSFGAPILGTAKHIEEMHKDMLQDFVTQNYTPSNMVVSASGRINHDDMVAMAEDLFGGLDAPDSKSTSSAQYKGGECRADKELEQTHVVLGFEGISRLNDEFYAAQMLAAILGGGMSSRLFQEVRENRGLAYSVYAYHSGYEDTGNFSIYAGTSPEKSGELVHVMCDEALKIIDDIQDDEITRAKHQMKSSLVMSRESMMSRANGQAKYLLQRNAVLDQNHILEQVDAIDRGALQSVAKTIFQSRPTLCSHGILSNVPDHDAITARLAA